MQILFSALIAAAIVFAVETYRSAPILQRILSFAPLDLYLISSIPIIFATIDLAIKAAQQQRISRGRWTFFVASAAVSSFGAAASFVYSIDIRNTNASGALNVLYAGLFAAFFATLGWIITNYLNFVNGRKAHTMSVLMQMRTSSIFQDHMLNICKHFNLQEPISRETAKHIRNESSKFNTWADKSEWPVHKSLLYITNYYEFMCLGINTGDLDARMMKKSMHSIIRNFYKFNKSVIDLAREDDFGTPNELIFCELKKIAKDYGLDI